MFTYKAGDNVKNGYFFNRDEWTMVLAPQEGLALPGGEGERYVKLPTSALLVAAPLLGLAFVVFMPFVGLVLLGKRLVCAVVEILGVGFAAVKARRGVWE